MLSERLLGMKDKLKSGWKIFPNYISDRKLVSRIHKKKKNLKTQLKNHQKIQLENEQKTQRDKKDIQIAKKHFERCLISLAVREM